jgi:4-amino-4-deoxy-L-arabinose transferase-like glycosyltransferase
MTRGAFGLVAASMLALGAAVRINNALVFPPLQAYDGFSHFSYVWFMAEEWRVPLATTGWEFFQPPLYYWLMAALWHGLAPLDPVLRLRLGTMAVGLLGLSIAGVAWLIVRRELPGDRIPRLLAFGLMLFVPVHLYTAGFLGNENLTAVVSAWALCVLLATLRRPTVLRAAALGLVLGLAMLTKFTGLVVVVAAFGTFALRMLVRGDWRTDGRAAAVAAVVMLLVCGWFYGRNVWVYGTPFQMSRETFMMQRYEHIQTRGERGFLEYVLFDPMILRRPEWPRGVGLVGEAALGPSALRESVPTGLYANTWFEGYGGFVMPKVTQDEAVRRSGQALLTLGLVPTALMAIGFGWALVRLRRDGWDDALVAMLLAFGAMMAVVVHGTHSVPLHAAVKATYLMPASVVFAFWLALGAAWVGRRSRPVLHAATALSAVLGLLSAFVFLQGRTVGRWWLEQSSDNPLWRNVAGVVYYAAGDTTRARALFERVAADGYHLGWENLAMLALEEDRPVEALYALREAARLQPSQSLGTPVDQQIFNQLTRAEYLNTMAVLYHRLGRESAALAAAQESVVADPGLPEAAYDLALLKLARAYGGAERDEAPWRRAFLSQSRMLLSKALLLDPGFREARALAGVAAALAGECPDAVAAIEHALDDRGQPHRLYPVRTGVGDLLASTIRRRVHISDVPEIVRPEYQLSRCRDRQRTATRGSGDDRA